MGKIRTTLRVENTLDAGKPGLEVDVTARVISGVASHIQVEETEALHVSRIAL
ncbi:MAG: hypothetical protein BECKG1743E_GA0114224_104851, partial [Candidatus Kentron sp. G]